jgi:hypothetical protein
MYSVMKFSIVGSTYLPPSKGYNGAITLYSPYSKIIISKVLQSLSSCPTDLQKLQNVVLGTI